MSDIPPNPTDESLMNAIILHNSPSPITKRDKKRKQPMDGTPIGSDAKKGRLDPVCSTPRLDLDKMNASYLYSSNETLPFDPKDRSFFSQ